MTKSLKAFLMALMVSLTLTSAAQAAPRLKMSPVIPALPKKSQNVRSTILFAYQHNVVLNNYVNSRMSPDRLAIANVALDSKVVQMRRVTCKIGGPTCPIYAGTLKGAIVQSSAYKGKRIRAYNVQIADKYGTHSLVLTKSGALLSGAKKDKKAKHRTISQGAFTTTGVIRYLQQTCDGVTNGVSTTYAKFAEQPVTLSSSTGGNSQFRQAVVQLQASNPDATTPVPCATPTPAPTPTPQPTPNNAPSCDQNQGVTVTWNSFTPQKDQTVNVQAHPVASAGETLVSVDWYWGDGTSGKETTTTVNFMHTYANATSDRLITAVVHYASGKDAVCKGVFKEVLAQ